ncbi:MAG TPA: enoyl-CoA hydratase/isomerase family protein [Terriglobales bacterium]|nr:enoyl-CoA hydratase/isomerase family protein [Terriglobales bacterium]
MTTAKRKSSNLSTSFELDPRKRLCILRLQSSDGTNRLTRACVLGLTDAIAQLTRDPKPLIIAGNPRFFSAGADLAEIAALTGPAAYEFSKIGQHLMNQLENFPAPVYAAIDGYCMGGGLDLALACHRRIASPHAIFGHRGAASGLMTGWGGTQRLPRLVGKARALELFLTAEKLHASQALAIGLVDAIADNPVDYCLSGVHISLRAGYVESAEAK